MTVRKPSPIEFIELVSGKKLPVYQKDLIKRLHNETTTRPR